MNRNITVRHQNVTNYDALLTVHLSIMLAIDQLKAQIEDGTDRGFRNVGF